MKNKALIIVIIFIIFTVSGCSKNQQKSDLLDQILKRQKIIVGVKYDTKPFSYMNENKELIGYDIDIAKNIAKNILGDENKIEFVEVTPANRISALNSDKVDMVIATMTATKERRKILNFSRPYYVAGQAILIPNDSNIKSMSDLNGKRVIIIFGTTSEKNIRLIAPDSNIIGFKTYSGAFAALKQGYADALTSDDTILLGFALSDNTVKLLPKRYTKEPYAVGFKKNDRTKRLERRVDSIIEDMEKQGDLNRLKNKWVNY